MSPPKYFKIAYIYHNGSISCGDIEYLSADDETGAIVKLVDEASRKAKKLGHTFAIEKINDIQTMSIGEFDEVMTKQRKHREWNNLLKKLKV